VRLSHFNILLDSLTCHDHEELITPEDENVRE
jgi:hypothetical protein